MRSKINLNRNYIYQFVFNSTERHQKLLLSVLTSLHCADHTIIWLNITMEYCCLTKNFGLIHSLNFDKKITKLTVLLVSVQHFLHSSARWIQTCPAYSEVIYNLAGSCKNNCLNKCGLGRQYWNSRYKWGKQNYTHSTYQQSSQARKTTVQFINLVIFETIPCNPACFLKDMLDIESITIISIFLKVTAKKNFPLSVKTSKRCLFNPTSRRNHTEDHQSLLDDLCSQIHYLLMLSSWQDFCIFYAHSCELY